MGQGKATFNKVWVERDVKQGNVSGFMIHASFHISGTKGQKCTAVAYVDSPQGVGLPDKNGKYCTTDGKVCATREFTLFDVNSSFADVPIFLPYDEMHLLEGSHRYYVRVFIHGPSGNLIPGNSDFVEFFNATLSTASNTVPKNVTDIQPGDPSVATPQARQPQTADPNNVGVSKVPQKPAYNPPPRKADGTLLAPIISDYYVNSESFIGLDGKKYYICFCYIYNDKDQTNSSKYAVNIIYIIPEDWKPRWTVKINYPPRIYGFVNHNNEFAAVAMFETSRGGGVHYDEWILPEDITEKLMDIVNNENPGYEFFNNKFEIKGYCTKSSELRWYYEYSYRDLCK